MQSAGDLPRVTYLSMDPLTSTVGRSQVLNYVERLAASGVSVDLVTFEHSVDVDIRQGLCDLGVHWTPQVYGRAGPLGGLGRVLRGSGVIRGSALVHARSDLAAAAAMLAGIQHWVWDVRSLWVDQKVATGVVRPNSLQGRILRWVERQAALRATAVITLTESAVDELGRRYGETVTQKAQVITTCSDLEHFSLSPMPAPPLRVLLSGTINRYYDMYVMLAVVEELRRRRPVEFILASPDATSWEAELASVEVVRLSARPDEMAQLVASCHLGLSICRDDAGVSLKAAMPTKIGELLASGRPVVVNPGLADAARLVRSNRCGAVIGSSGPCNVKKAVDVIEECLADTTTPQRCRALAESHFDLGSGIESLLDVYHSAKL